MEQEGGSGGQTADKVEFSEGDNGHSKTISDDVTLVDNWVSSCAYFNESLPKQNRFIA